MITGNSCSPGCKMSLPQMNRPPYFCFAMQHNRINRILCSLIVVTVAVRCHCRFLNPALALITEFLQQSGLIAIAVYE